MDSVSYNLIETIGNQLGIDQPDISKIKRSVYQNTECGAWIEFAEVIVDYQRVIHSWTEEGCFFCKEGKHNSAYDLVRVK